MPTKTKKKSLPRFTVRRIANRNPRHARSFLRVHRRLWLLTLLFIILIATIGGLLATTGNLSGENLRAGIFSISGSGPGWSGTIGTGVTGPAINGPGAQVGFGTFGVSYFGNKYGSAIGMIAGWTNFVLPFISVLAIAALIYAGFLYITGLGNDEQIQKAKKIIIWVVIGIIVILSAYAIVNTVLSGDGTT